MIARIRRAAPCTSRCPGRLRGIVALFVAHAAYAQQPQRRGASEFSSWPSRRRSKDAQAFRQGLRDAGTSEGHDVVIEWRSANGDYDRLPELAADLVQRKVDVIVVRPRLQRGRSSAPRLPSRSSW